MKSFFDIFKRKQVALPLLFIFGFLSIVFNLVYNIGIWSNNLFDGPTFIELIISILFISFIVIGYALNKDYLFKVGFTFFYIYNLLSILINKFPSTGSFSSNNALIVLTNITSLIISFLAILILAFNLFIIFKLGRNSLILYTSLFWLIIVALNLLNLIFYIVLVSQGIDWIVLISAFYYLFISSFLFTSYGLFVENRE